MDYSTSRNLANQLKNLDAAIVRGDRIAIMIATQAIDDLLRSTDIGSTEPALPGVLPNWIKQVIRDQGLRIPALEGAVSAQKVIIRPTFGGSGFGVELKIEF